MNPQHLSERERHEGILHKVQKKTDSADSLGVQLPGFWNHVFLSLLSHLRERGGNHARASRIESGVQFWSESPMV